MRTTHLRPVSRRNALLGGLSTLGAATILGGCSVSAAETANPAHETNVVRYQGWAGEVTFFELAEDLGLLNSVRLEWIGNTTSGPQDIQSTVTGDVDIGGAFNGAIIRLAAAGAPIKAVLGYYGADAYTLAGYYVPEGSSIRGPRDFIDKKVGVNTLGAHHQDVLAIYLERGGLTQEEIESVQLVVVPPVSAEQSLRSGQLDVAALSDVLREKALARGGIRPVFSDFELLGAFTAGCYVLRDDFIGANPTTTRILTAGTARAIQWAQTRSRDEVIGRFIDIINRRDRNEDISTAQYWKSTGVANPGGLIAEREFGMWIRRLVSDGVLRPGHIQSERLYTNEFNPVSRPGGTPS